MRDRLSPRKTITEDDVAHKRISGMHFRRSITMLSTGGTSSKHVSGKEEERQEMEEESESEEDSEDDSFKTEFEDSEPAHEEEELVEESKEEEEESV